MFATERASKRGVNFQPILATGLIVLCSSEFYAIGPDVARVLRSNLSVVFFAVSWIIFLQLIVSNNQNCSAVITVTPIWGPYAESSRQKRGNLHVEP